MLRVLFVEDEEKVRNFVREGLQASGMFIEASSSLDEAELLLSREHFDVLLLDRLIHGKDSLSHLSKLRSLAKGARVIILSALSEVDQRVLGLDQGADDYLGKPFHIRELISRIHALARRPNQESAIISNGLLVFADLHINLETQEVTRSGHTIELSAKEFKLLSALASRPKKIFSKQELLDRIWGTNLEVDTNVVEVGVARLRGKVDLPNLQPLIQTKRGVGYFLDTKKHDED